MQTLLKQINRIECRLKVFNAAQYLLKVLVATLIVALVGLLVSVPFCCRVAEMVQVTLGTTSIVSTVLLVVTLLTHFFNGHNVAVVLEES